jgi:hypothetical protein
MELEYPWYNVVQRSDVLAQGDMIEECLIVIPPASILSEEFTDITIRTYNVLILTQSCDLENSKIESVLVCPYYTLTEFVDAQPFFKSRDSKEQLRRGNQPGYHLLNKFDGAETGFHSDYIVADFRNVYGVSFTFLKEFALGKPERLSLLSPYREHLSQALARYFMRVGLPSDIPEFKKG